MIFKSKKEFILSSLSSGFSMFSYPNPITDQDLYFTVHARNRLAEMSVNTKDVVEAVAEPQLEYDGRPDRNGESRRVAVRGRLAVVLSPNRRTVVTVLWNGLEGREAA